MKENLNFILIFSGMMISILYLSGCAGSFQSKTGHLTCFGFCQLVVDHTDADGATTGVAGAPVKPAKPLPDGEECDRPLSLGAPVDCD